MNGFIRLVAPSVSGMVDRQRYQKDRLYHFCHSAFVTHLHHGISRNNDNGSMSEFWAALDPIEANHYY